jgi:RNA polymerase sigma factor (sigma-70 family)
MAHARLGPVLRHVHRFLDDDGLRPPDAELLTHFVARRDEAAFAALVQRHGPMVLAVCRRVLGHAQDAEDAFQATFLALARRAATVRQAASAAGWLHGAARRAALCARRAAERRRKHEGRARSMAQRSPSEELTWREARAILDEEIGRLPEAQRAAFVLCCLEGRGQAEAARQLGVSEGAVAGRLDAARKRLRRRLTRRGVGLAAVLAAAAVAGEADAAPAALSAATAQAAAAYATGAAAPAALAGLAKAAARGVLAARTKTAAVLLAAGLLAASAGALAQQAAAPKAAESAPPAGEDDRPAAAGEPARADAYGDPLPDDARLRLGTVRLRQEGFIRKVVFGPGGKTLLCASENPRAFAGSYRSLVLWDAADGKLLHRFRRDDHLANMLRAVAYFPDGKTVAAAYYGLPGSNSYVVLWDAETEKQIREILVENADVRALAVSADGKSLYTAASAGEPTRCFDAESGKERWNCPGHPRGESRLAASPVGQTLASTGGSADGYEIAFWDAKSGERRNVIPAHKGAITDLAYSADGKTLVATSSGGTASLWDVESGKRIQEIRHPKGEQMWTAALAPDGKTLATAGDGRVVRLWDPETGKESGRLEGAGEPTHSLSFTPDGKTLAAAAGSSILLWDVKTGKQILPAEGHHGELRAVAFSPAAALLASAGDDHAIVLWDATTGKEVRRLAGHGGRVAALAFSPDGKLLASGGDENDATVRVWNVASGKELARFEGHRCVGRLSFAPDGRTLTSADARDAVVRTWRVIGPDGAVVDGGKPVGEFKVNDIGESGMAVSPDGKLLAAADDPRGLINQPSPIHLWDRATGKELRQLEGHIGEGPIRGLAFSPDGKLLASAGTGPGDQSIRLWDVESGKELRRFAKSVDEPALRTRAARYAAAKFRRFAGSVDVLAFSPDGKTLAGTGLSDSVVLVWEVATGAERRRFSGHAGAVTSLAFSADGRTLASAGDDTTVLLWDLTGAATAKRPAPTTDAEQDSLWRDLGADAALADDAVRTLTAAESSVSFFKQRLRPVEAADEKRVARLLADLDGDDFETREKAGKELEKVVESAEPLLRRALAGKPSVEVQQRLEHLLDGEALKAARLRALRATEALERDGGPAARELLQSLAKGDADAFLTRQAKASLGRLAGRAAVP